MTLTECAWPVDTANCCPPLDESPGEVDLVARMIEVASGMLTRLSGYTIGLCTATIRPLRICQECRGWCCGGTDGLPLRGPLGIPVHDVTAVHEGAVTVPADEWHWDVEVQTLWRVPPDTWPQRDERWSDCGTGEAFCVDVVVGTEPDAWALQVAESLTCELVKNCLGEKCRIPRNATQVTGQGVTITLRDDDINHLLPEVTGWVKAVNPHRARLPARIYSPDLQPARGEDGVCCGR